MYKNQYYNQFQNQFQENLRQQRQQFFMQQQAEYEKQFSTMSDEHIQKFKVLCTDAQLTEPEREVLFADVRKSDVKEVAEKLNIDISTETGKQIYQTILQSANNKIVAKYGGGM
jgi:hypothetical protein